MSNSDSGYQVIARKWRPQTFDAMIGQGHVSQTLLNALKSGRLPHALLFTGPRGVGKTSSARILAKSLKCPTIQDSEKNFSPCNVCSTCQEITSGHSLDVVEIDGASHNGVDAIRELRETIAYMPSQGKYKIYIIDEVHMLSVSAFNALLKTLEEPPPHVIFIFATTEPQKIPLTILSRVQRFDFRRIPTRLLMERLKTICEKDAVAAEVEALWMIARQSDGSARDSQSLLDQIITFSDKKITLEKVIEVLGLTDRQMLLKTIEALIDRSTEQALQIIEKIYYAGYDSKIFVQELLEELRNLLILKISGKANENLVDLPDSEIGALKALGEKLSPEDIHLLFDMALKGAQDCQRAHDPKLALEMLLLRMSQAPRIESILNLPSSSTPTGPQNVTSPKEKAKATPAATPLRVQSDNLSDRWTQTVTAVKTHKAALGAKLEHFAMKAFKDKTLTLSASKEKKFLFDQLNDAKTLKELSAIITEVWQEPVTVAIEMNAETTPIATLSPAEMQKQKVLEAQATTRTQVESHPLVQKIQQTFKTEIKSIKEMP